MLAKSTFPGHVISSVAGLIRSLDGDPEAIAVAAGVPVAVLSDPSLPIDAGAGLRFVEMAAEVCHCDTIGLQMGAQVDMTFLGPVWVLMQDAKTVRELLQDLERHLVVITTAISLGLLDNRDGMICTIDIVGGGRENDRQAIEYGLCQVVRYLRERLGTSWNSPSVQFRHRAPENLQMHRRHLGPNIFFDCERTGFLVDTQTLNRELAHSHRGHAILAATLKNELPLDWQIFPQKVEGMIRAIMPFTLPTQERIAKELMVSTRSLQRYLAESGTNFNEIRDKVRALLAAKYLSQSSLSVEQIAELLGYSQSSAFCRSFARWYGTSPLKYQKDQQAQFRQATE